MDAIRRADHISGTLAGAGESTPRGSRETPPAATRDTVQLDGGRPVPPEARGISHADLAQVARPAVPAPPVEGPTLKATLKSKLGEWAGAALNRLASGGLMLRTETQAPPPSAASLDVSEMRSFPSSRVTCVYDPGGRSDVKNPQLVGSWDSKGWYSQRWTTTALPMEKGEDGKYRATVELRNDAPHDWQWGVTGEVAGHQGEWMIPSEGNRKLSLTAPQQVEEYAPTTYHKMGAHREGNDLGFRVWIPFARDVQVKMLPADGPPTLVPMTQDARTGMWGATMPGAWDKMQGQPYVYQVTTSEGKVQELSDPYARQMEGAQRGVGRVYLHAQTGQEIHKFWQVPKLEMLRFEVQGHEKADSVDLVFRDDSGNALGRDELMKRLGTVDSKLVSQMHGGKFTDLWSDLVKPDGHIPLVRQGRAWATLVNNIPGLDGLHYEFQVRERDAAGQATLVGDRNRDGVLQPGERAATAFNDPFSNRIDAATIGSPRASIITASSFEFKHDDAPRMETDPKRFVIYQMHVGSVFGEAGNVTRSTFKDLIAHLDYMKSMGVNCLELLPTNEFEGSRDWGYIGTSHFAQAEAYGFEDDNGQWVNGTEALKRFIDAAHEKGFNVFNDVVYNHFGGDFNGLWNVDGAANPYFNWKDGKTVPGADGKPVVNKEIRDTPWGAMPAFNRDAVRQFVVDNASMQVEELHFDGLRFDFTHPIQDQGSEGWTVLRDINRTVKLFKPGTMTVAEEFPYDPALTEPARPDGSGAGFNAEWNTEFQHRLVHDNDNPSIIQQAARGWQTNMDRFMDELVNHPGFSSWEHSVTVVSDHDEVGNAERTVSAASGDQIPELPSTWARGAARFAFGIGMTSPGVPMFFQGEESLAKNPFKWGVPSTWDSGWDWMNANQGWPLGQVSLSEGRVASLQAMASIPAGQRAGDAGYQALSAGEKKMVDDLGAMAPEERQAALENAFRRLHHDFCKDAIALRNASPAFSADAPLARIYTHNENSVLAFSRKGGNDEFVVVGSLSHQRQSGYHLPLPEGRWQLVLDSDDVKYGGDGAGGPLGTTLQGGAGAVLDLPAGGMLVYKRVG